MKSRSKKRTSSIVNLTVKRRYLTEREVERLMNRARKHSRHGHRDATMILVAYRHGLRASEVCDLQWQQIELSEGRLIKEAALRIIGTFAAAAARASTMSPRYAHSAADPNGGMPNGAGRSRRIASSS